MIVEDVLDDKRRGDVFTAAPHAVLEIAPENDHLEQAGAAALVGLASWARGDLDAAWELVEEAFEPFLRDMRRRA